MNPETGPATSKTKKGGVAPWMWFLGTSATLTLVINSLFAYVAVRHGPGLVREDYYQAGLHWDQRRARETGFDSLGIGLALRPDADTLVVEGSAAQAVEPSTARRLGGYALELDLRRPDDADADRDLHFSPPVVTAGGSLQWRTVTSPLRRGRWDCRVVFRQNGQARMERSFEYFAAPE